MTELDKTIVIKQQLYFIVKGEVELDRNTKEQQSTGIVIRCCKILINFPSFLRFYLMLL